MILLAGVGTTVRIAYRLSDTQSIDGTGHQTWNLRKEMMVSQFELKIMPENDPSSIMPSRALTDLLPAALPCLASTQNTFDKTGWFPRAASLQSMHHIPLHYPTLMLSSARYTGPSFRE
jgi:hypothetical protein